MLQRQALLDAAKLAGLNVLGLIHSHAGACPGGWQWRAGRAGQCGVCI